MKINFIIRKIILKNMENGQDEYIDILEEHFLGFQQKNEFPESIQYCLSKYLDTLQKIVENQVAGKNSSLLHKWKIKQQKAKLEAFFKK